VDIITGTLGKAIGGAMGGYTCASKEVVEVLRQRSRPYLFSNSLAPSIVGASIKALELIDSSTALIKKVQDNTAYFKKEMQRLGFDIMDGDSAIVPVMLYDAKLSQNMADALLEEGIYVIGFFYPVVPKDKARIRVQLSAAHTKEHLDHAITAFEKIGKQLKVI
jgi:glycine C-acetyltransferase